MIARNGAGVVRPEDDASDLVAEKVGDELLLAFIAVKVDFIVGGRIIMNNLGCDFGFGAAAQDDFVGPHKSMLVTMTTFVEKRLQLIGL